MSDKYEDAAREYMTRLADLIVTTPPRFQPAFDLSDAFRWYEETYLAKKAEETCEWVKNQIGWYSIACTGWQAYKLPDNGMCPHCNSRIVEPK